MGNEAVAKEDAEEDMSKLFMLLPPHRGADIGKSFRLSNSMMMV